MGRYKGFILCRQIVVKGDFIVLYCLAFSSPHLVEVRERMCINGASLERDKFATYFWEVYNKLDSTKVSQISENPNSVSCRTVIPHLHIPFLFHNQVG